MNKLSNMKPIIMDVIDKALKERLVLGNLVANKSAKIATEGKAIEIPRLEGFSMETYTGSMTHKELDGAKTTLNVDQQKYFSIKVDEVDEKQAIQGVTSAITEQGANEMAFVIEQTIAKEVAKAKKTVNASIASGNLLNGIRLAGAELSKANVPMTGRFLVVSPDVASQILAELPTISKGDNALAMAIQGYVGKYAGFDIYESNAVLGAEGTTHQCIASYRGSIAYASQIEKLRTIEDPTFFGELIQGLVSFGTVAIETEEGKTNRIVNLTVDVTNTAVVDTLSVLPMSEETTTTAKAKAK